MLITLKKSVRNKRHKGHTIAERQKILLEFDEINMPSNKKAAEYLGIPSSTLHSILKERAYLNSVPKEVAENRIKNRRGQFPEIELALTKWINVAKEHGWMFTQFEIMDKAVEFDNKLNGKSEFSGNIRWLSRFFKRTGIVYKIDFEQKRLMGESLNANYTEIGKEIEDRIVDEVKTELQTRRDEEDKRFNNDENVKSQEKIEENNNEGVEEKHIIVKKEIIDDDTPLKKTKRKQRNCNTIARRQKILQDFDELIKTKNISNSKAAEFLGIPRSTLHSILHERDYLNSIPSEISKYQKIRNGLYPEIELAVVKWLIAAKENGWMFSQREILQKAMEFGQKLNGKSKFPISEKWLQRLFKRSGITYKIDNELNKLAEESMNNNYSEIGKALENQIVEEVKAELRNKESLKQNRSKKLIKSFIIKSETRNDPLDENKSEANLNDSATYDNTDVAFEEVIDDMSEESVFDNVHFNDDKNNAGDTIGDKVSKIPEIHENMNILKRGLLHLGYRDLKLMEEFEESVNKCLKKHEEELAWKKVKDSLLKNGYSDHKLLEKFEESMKGNL